jgi:hypothetical protein
MQQRVKDLLTPLLQQHSHLCFVKVWAALHRQLLQYRSRFFKLQVLAGAWYLPRPCASSTARLHQSSINASSSRALLL